MQIGDIYYNIEIIRKNNKNTYIRVKNNTIIVTTNYLTTNRQIEKLINNNKDSIIRMASKVKKREDKESDDTFYLFGKKYNIVFEESIKNIEIDNNNIYIKDEKKLDNFLNKYIKNTFYNHLMYWYNNFIEKIPEPSLRIRKMTSRWGVCNTKTHVITLNKELYKYDIECLDYVCIHELSHLVHPNHSSNFWSVVSEYCPNYKEIRKKLRG